MTDDPQFERHIAELLCKARYAHYMSDFWGRQMLKAMKRGDKEAEQEAGIMSDELSREFYYWHHVIEKTREAYHADNEVQS